MHYQDKTEGMSSGKVFDEVLKRLLVDTSIKTSTMFGMRCAKISGKAFIGLHMGRLVIKVGPVRAQNMFMSRQGEPFDPGNLGKPMRDWVMLPVPAHYFFIEELVAQWLSLAEEAKQFAKNASVSRSK
jgi:hypothetical protein